MIQVEIDPHSGFCGGVIRAISTAEQTLAEGGRLYSLGAIVHNEEELARLEARGLVTIERSDLLRMDGSVSGESLLIRAHGEPPQVYDRVRGLGLRLIDCTCPVVLGLQKEIREAHARLDASGGQIVIFGKIGHPEVLGLVGQVDGGVTVGVALQLRDRIFAYLRQLDQQPTVQLCNEIENFLDKELCIQLPLAHSEAERVELLRTKLNRPIRVCGMVKNEGEPGGGPYIIAGKDGSTSLQILESVQINPDDAGARAAMSRATHFNPVDLVCCLRDYKGGKFDLLAHVDPEAGFISSKSYEGRELKALELPGLWNGSMSDWNTLFVEVPIETFNPVKVVLDLLRPAHQA